MQCFLKVKDDLSKVVKFQHVAFKVQLIAWIDALLMVKDILIYRKNELFLFNKFETLFLSYLKVLNLSLP